MINTQNESSKVDANNEVKRLLFALRSKYKRYLQECVEKEKRQCAKNQDLKEENAALIAQVKALKELLQKSPSGKELPTLHQEMVDLQRLLQAEKEKTAKAALENRTIQVQLKSTKKALFDLNLLKQEYESKLGSAGSFSQRQGEVHGSEAQLLETIRSLKEEKKQWMAREKAILEQLWLEKEKASLSRELPASNHAEDLPESERITALMQTVQEKKERAKKVDIENRRLSKSLEESLEEKHKLEATVAALRHDASEMEKDLVLLREKSEEAKLNAKAVGQVCDKSQKMIHELTEKEVELQAEYQNSQKKVSLLETELTNLVAQFEEIKTECKRQKEAISVYEKSEKQRQQLIEKNSVFEKTLLEKEKEAAMMKTTLIASMKEAGEIKRHYQQLLNERTSLLSKTARLQERVRELTEEKEKSQHSLTEETKERLKFQTKLKETEKKLQEKEENLASFAQQIKQMHSQLRELERAAEENDQNLFEAQTQFAKKAREVARLTETNEEMKLRIEGLKDQLVEAKTEVGDSLSAHQAQQKQMERLKEQISELKQRLAAEEGKKQQLELQVKEMQNIEEKHLRIQRLLANFSGVFELPEKLTQKRQPVNENKPNSTSLREQSVQKRQDEDRERSLFDQPVSHPTYKRDLFEGE